jgi:hypothetical protein
MPQGLSLWLQTAAFSLNIDCSMLLNPLVQAARQTAASYTPAPTGGTRSWPSGQPLSWARLLGDAFTPKCATMTSDREALRLLEQHKRRCSKLGPGQAELVSLHAASLLFLCGENCNSYCGSCPDSITQQQPTHIKADHSQMLHSCPTQMLPHRTPQYNCCLLLLS